MTNRSRSKASASPILSRSKKKYTRLNAGNRNQRSQSSLQKMTRTAKLWGARFGFANKQASRGLAFSQNRAAMNTPLNNFARSKLDALEQAHLRRVLVDSAREDGVWIERGGKRLLSFSCND